MDIIIAGLIIIGLGAVGALLVAVELLVNCFEIEALTELEKIEESKNIKF